SMKASVSRRKSADTSRFSSSRSSAMLISVIVGPLVVVAGVAPATLTKAHGGLIPPPDLHHFLGHYPAGGHRRQVQQPAQFRIALFGELAPTVVAAGVAHPHIQPEIGDEGIVVAEGAAAESHGQGSGGKRTDALDGIAACGIRRPALLPQQLIDLGPESLLQAPRLPPQ